MTNTVAVLLLFRIKIAISQETHFENGFARSSAQTFFCFFYTNELIFIEMQSQLVTSSCSFNFQVESKQNPFWNEIMSTRLEKRDNFRSSFQFTAIMLFITHFKIFGTKIMSQLRSYLVFRIRIICSSLLPLWLLPSQYFRSHSIFKFTFLWLGLLMKYSSYWIIRSLSKKFDYLNSNDSVSHSKKLPQTVNNCLISFVPPRTWNYFWKIAEKINRNYA